MTLHMQTQQEPFDSYVTVSLDDQKISDIKLQMSYSHPARLSFTVNKPQHLDPLGIGAFIRFWDDSGTNPRTAAAYDADNPTFEGHIAEVQPGDDANEIHYVAYDPTKRAADDVWVMSEAWAQGTVGSGSTNNKPEPGTGAVPRLVFNSKIDNDDDYMWERTHDDDVGTMIETILEDSYHPLYWLNAAPGDGSSAGNGTGYVASDTNAMTFKPQEKQVFESETVRSALERLLQNEPAYKLLFIPGQRVWRFLDLTAASQTTLTLNEYDGTHKVLSLNLDRSIEGRYTAVKFYGPPAAEQKEVTLKGGGLTDI